MTPPAEDPTSSKSRRTKAPSSPGHADLVVDNNITLPEPGTSKLTW
jgi:hypothetical protein